MSPEGTRIEHRIVPAPGFRSAEVALKVAELTEIHGQLVEAVRPLTAAQFAWQSSPGRNTIGMLLTHIALAETHLGQVGLRGEPAGHVQDVLGITVEDDAMPLAADGVPPTTFATREFAFFDALLAQALAHTRAACEPLHDARLGEEIVRPRRPDGSYWVFDRRWVLHHMVEHAAQHLGQIQVVKRDLPAH